MLPPEAGSAQDARREILRQAAAALGGRVVTLWEISPDGAAAPVLTSAPRTPAAAPGLDEMLRRWGELFAPSTRWVACRLDDTRWCAAPVRYEPPAPPPGGVERRSRERLTLELAGLCLGLAEAVRPPPIAPAQVHQHELGAEASEFLRQPRVIAHEAANPLTAALVSLGLCREMMHTLGGLNDQSRTELLEEMANVRAGIDQAAAVLQVFKERAHGPVARAERFDAVPVARSCLAIERPLARDRAVTLDEEIGVDSVFLQGDPQAFYQLMANLVRNAVTASEGRAAPVGVVLRSDADRLWLTVRDRGLGIPPEHLGRIFEPGFTTKSDGRGAGLGLAVVQTVARDVFGGAINVDSVVGEGSVFTVALPLPAQRA